MTPTTRSASSRNSSTSDKPSTLPEEMSVESPIESTVDGDNAPEKKKSKKRYSKQLKRDRKAQHLHETAKQQCVDNTAPERTVVRTRRPPLTWLERILQCARLAQSTGTALLDEPLHQVETVQRVRLVTSSSLEQSRRIFAPNPPYTNGDLTIRVKPLLILDLNGILCHRSRKHKEPPGVQLRHSIGTAAGTPIVPRTDWIPFLEWLDRNFSLAVWTSAQRKTANSMLKLLFPPDIQKRLVCVWAQSNCNAVYPPKPTKDSSTTTGSAGKGQGKPQGFNSEVIFEKRLDDFWRAFPLWNANNTILIDDSPEKCPFASGNAVHPPEIHGQRRPPLGNQPHQGTGTAGVDWVPDEDNQDLQREFFLQYNEFWSKQPFQEFLSEETVPSLVPQSRRDMEDDDSPKIPVQEVMTNEALYWFLKKHASNHMGWRDPSRSR